MKAILLEQPGTFRRIDIDEPSSLGPDDALVRVHRIGICGTDISGYLGKMPFYSYPRIPGHELGVEVLAVGVAVKNVRPGDRCCVEPYMNCQTCFACLRGGQNCCENLQVLGVHTDGGMRTRFVLPARKLHPAPNLSLDQCALVETLAIGCHAVNRGAPAADEHLLVIGAGPIGLAVIEFAMLAGARVTVLDMNAKRLTFCKDHMKVHHTIVARGDDSDLTRLRAAGDGNLPTVVIDATGSPRSMSNALNYVGHTGKLVYVGIVTADISFPHPLMHRRELTLYASRNALPDDFRRIIGLIESGKIDTTPWITHRITMDEVIDAFPSFTKPETGVIKAIVEVGE